MTSSFIDSKTAVRAIRYVLMIMAVNLNFTLNSLDNKELSIEKNDRIIVGMDTNRYNYFLQNGTPCGYQFELFKIFSTDKKLDIEFRLISDSTRCEMLKNCEIDIAVFSDGIDSLQPMVFGKHPDLCSTIPLDDTVKSVWLVRESDMNLLLLINHWAGQLKEQCTYENLQRKYFERKYDKKPGILSPYDKLLKKYSAEIGWDWRLLGAIVYNESRFRPDVVSPSGAMGLMQLMPVTAKYWGVNDVYNPEENIRGGVRLIKFLWKIYGKKELAEEERIKFVLASYNAGHGRVEKCRRIAASRGLDPDLWSDVNLVFPVLNDPKFNTSETKVGGRETINFVKKVLESYSHYQRLLAV
ncbi:MAG: transglycosylase SLT domain-containing protein [Prevotellaceae bacterium]|jgi:membrane-bound lytic murein transglycosylase F|nr:transglycosylase SLT domain-containing protein [Prevotellaceae bacterium]